MIRPTWVCQFKRHRDENGQVGTRWDYSAGTGPSGNTIYGPLYCPLKRAPYTPVVYLNRPFGKRGSAPDPRRPALGLFAPGGHNITGVFEPSPEHPGRGFGDVDRTDALLIHRDDAAQTMAIYVFPGLGLQSLSLFMAWVDGGVCLEPEGAQRQALYNKSYLATESVTAGYA